MSEQTINPPDLDTLLLQLRSEIFANLNCHQIGKIEKVNSNQTVEVSIQVKRRVSGDKTVNYPLLVDCPYIILQGGGSYISFPISPGDYCLVLFNDRNIDEWWSSENIKEPQDRRKHNLSDGIALVGLNSDVNYLQPVSDVITINGSDNKISVYNNAENMLTLMEDLIDAVNAIIISDGATISAASQAALNAIKTRIGDLLS